MSLLKLLTSGKSLVGLKDSGNRYRMINQKLLPKFGSTNNPFREAETSNIKHQPFVAPEVPEKNARKGASLLRSGTAKCRSLAATALQSRWVLQLSSLLSRPAARVPKPALPVFAKPPVQVELSLDRIKVVRNDLSDADLEVVAAKPQRKAGPTPVVLPGEAAESVGGAPPRATARVLANQA